MKLTQTFQLAALAAALALAGCSNTKLDGPPPVEDRSTSTTAGTGTGTGANAGATSQSQVTPVDLTKNASAAAWDIPHTVYFDFDSFVVKEEYRPVIEANAKVLTGDRKKHVAVEGHTDERGSREYNIGLGERRAQAVRRALMLAGAQASQITTVSYGEERPAATGSDEESWRLNRRVEIVYR